MEFAVEVYRATAQFPRPELYGLSNLRHAAVSIPSHVAEGKGPRSAREWGHFLCPSRGSRWEVQTQSMIAEELQYLSNQESQADQFVGRESCLKQKAYD